MNWEGYEYAPPFPREVVRRKGGREGKREREGR
jgi:hypothetical protein